MIQKTRWRPDTCDCVLEYTWDDSVPSDQRIHVLESIQKCQFHQALDDQQAYDAVKDENTIKNKFLGHVLDNYPDLVDAKVDGSKEFKLGYDYEWSFNDDRKLQAEIIGADKATAQAIAVSADSDLGVDKVDVKIP